MVLKLVCEWKLPVADTKDPVLRGDANSSGALRLSARPSVVMSWLLALAESNAALSYQVVEDWLSSGWSSWPCRKARAMSCIVQPEGQWCCMIVWCNKLEAIDYRMDTSPGVID